MARAIWSGAISFGLVNVPVKLYSAVNRKTVRFNQINSETNQKVKQKRVDEESGEEVPFDQIVKGFELSPGRFVVITPDELDTLDPPKSRTIDILDFVSLEEIDPIYYDHPYYLLPADGAAKPYGLLRDAMEESGKVGIAKVVLRSKESLVAIRAAGQVLTMETMLYSDEVVPPSTLDDVPDSKSKPTARELKMAAQLVESLTNDFDPSSYKDEYRERVLDLIERKSQGEEITIEEPEAAPAKVPDLMAALEASISAVKSRQEGPGADEADSKPAPAKKPRARKAPSSNGAGPAKKPAAKAKAAAKPAAKAKPKPAAKPRARKPAAKK